jgi:hypothetical protein
VIKSCWFDYGFDINPDILHIMHADEVIESKTYNPSRFTSFTHIPHSVKTMILNIPDGRNSEHNKQISRELMNTINSARFQNPPNLAMNENIVSNEIEEIQPLLLVTNQSENLSSDDLSANSTNNVGVNNKRPRTHINYRDMISGRS